ncbi:DnaJ-domain-containing protein [Macroventuria anomochaeta]|uniref:DnaJ-domain-containing protein n=1 Tax=Macroventuria anomochaeta TaxID=301207 RepID=A0ACB6RUV1_9PLEO|nr:DnaJ-domain-containing protein [Macroventuria anomochaeta]KAF2625549.1 DnaJ-domain-containing protein [Macroventuria anomochaeta]
MLPRPLLFTRPSVRPQWTCQPCLQRLFVSQQPQVAQARLFHATAPRLSDSAPNHYETLQVAPTADAKEIKKQFYALSKKNHPDHNKDDPTASTRFVAISEAYHTLSVPEKREQYDAQLHQAERRSGWGRSGGGGHPPGSYSSASYAGSRPATGLNKKRGTFRGPPPSFYNSGGYGRHGAKRAEHAHHNPNAEGKEAGPESYGEEGGYGPGQQRQGQGVPHFDDVRHKQVHEQVHKHIQKGRRRSRLYRRDEEYARGGDHLTRFLIVSGIVAVIGATVKIFEDKGNIGQRKAIT